MKLSARPRALPFSIARRFTSATRPGCIIGICAAPL
jgi:hypothetical protein